MGYTMATIKALADCGVTVHLVHADKKKKTPYQAPAIDNVYTYPRSGLSRDQLQQLADDVEPQITVVSGWTDRDYLRVARRLRHRGRAVVCGLDGQWQGSFRQFIAAGLGFGRFFSRYFSHAWVAGAYQYEYARKLGYRQKDVVFDLLSADLSNFSPAPRGLIEDRRVTYPHRFLFVGRFEAIKGLDTLLDAWRLLGSGRGDWELHLVGNGSLQRDLATQDGIVVKDFVQPEALKKEFANAGCLVLPSQKEAWGVVVHEAAASGVPLVVSDAVGAAATFLIDGLNGYRFAVRNATELADRLGRIVNTPDAQLLEMGRRSRELSRRITPESSAANLLAVIS